MQITHSKVKNNIPAAKCERKRKYQTRTYRVYVIHVE